MKAKLWVALALLLMACPMFLAAGNDFQPSPEVRAVALRANLPLSFEPAAKPGHYLARSADYTVAITPSEAAIAIPEASKGSAHILRVALENADAAATIEPLDPVPGVTNYYRGSDSSHWRLGVANFARLRVKDVYPGVNLVYYGDQRRLEFDFIIAPGASTEAISLAFSGADKLSTDAAGNLVAAAEGHEIRLAKPVAYQRIDGAIKPVIAEYVLRAGKARLRLGDYDRRQELVIDPTVSYISYLGGSQSDSANGIAVDSIGNSYITGETCSIDFPDSPSPNPSGRSFSGSCDAYISMIKAADGTLGYTTIIGGNNPSNATAVGNAIALDKSNQVYITGQTNFIDLPLQVHPYYGGDSDAFIVILNTDGTLQNLTYLGGSSADIGYGIVVDDFQNVAVAGQTCSGDFPAYNGFEPQIEPCVAFVTEMDSGLHVAPRNYYPGASYYTPPPPPPLTATYNYYFSEFYGGQQALGPAPTTSWLPNTQYIIGAIITDPNGNSQLAVSGSGTSPWAGTSGNTAPTVWSSKLYSTTLDNACLQPPAPAAPITCPSVVWENLGPYNIPVAYATAARGIAMDPMGDVFVVGGTNTTSATGLSPYSTFIGTGAWVLKVLGSQAQSPNHPGGFVYGTTLETTAMDSSATKDTARAVAVDPQGRAYVVGTASGTLLTSGNAYRSAPFGGLDAFVVRLSTQGPAQIDYASYLGGSGDDQGLGVATNVNGDVYITGSTSSPDLPYINPITVPLGNPPVQTPVQTLDGSQDAFVSKFGFNGSAMSLTLSTYLGGSGPDAANAIAVGSDGNIHIAGTTSSPDLTTKLAQPTNAPAQNTYAGNGDAFVATISGALPEVLVSTGNLYFGTVAVNSTSNPQSVTIANTSTTAFVDITGITINGDFAQTPQAKNPPDCYTGSLAPVASCQIWATFTPTAAGNRIGAVTITTDASTSPLVVNLLGKGAVPYTVWTPAGLTFSTQNIGTTSAAQTVTVSNMGAGALNVASVSITGDFAQTNTCGQPVATNNSCTITVTFSPTATGTRSGTLLITDNDPLSSPQKVTLSGVGAGSAAGNGGGGTGGTGTGGGVSGTPDFSLSGSGSSITASATTPGSFTVTLTPTNGFNQTVSLTCAVPAPATCAVNPSSVVLSGASPGQATATVTIPSSGSSSNGWTISTHHGHPWHTLLPFSVFGLALVGKRRRFWMILLVVVLCLAMALVGCGGSGSSSNNNSSSNSGMAPGTYSMSVTATYAGTTPVTHTVNVSLQVTQ